MSHSLHRPWKSFCFCFVVALVGIWAEGSSAQAQVPNAPTNLVSKASYYSTSEYGYQLTWNDNSSDETSFIVSFSPDYGGNWFDLAPLPANTTKVEYNISSIYPNARWTVRAVNAKDNTGQAQGWDNVYDKET